MKSPYTKEPSRGGAVTSSLVFLVTSTDRHILSSGHSFFLAVDCMMAVRKDWGLKKPASHTVVGSAKSVVQASSSCGTASVSRARAPRAEVEAAEPGLPV